MTPAHLDRTPLTLVTGLDRTVSARIAHALAAPGTAIVSHDLRDVGRGRVTRSVHRIDLDGHDRFSLDDVELEHGCVSCTLRLDLLPLLRVLHREPGVARIVVALDPVVEPENVALEVRQTVVDVPGLAPAAAGDDVSLTHTVCGVDAGRWLDEATGDITLAEAGLSVDEDERTVAQVAVGQVRFADTVIVERADSTGGAWNLARLHAVLVRLAPGAGMRTLNSLQRLDTALMAGALGSGTRHSPHGVPRRPFDPLLAGRPDLDGDCGVELITVEAARPFHPERLHLALDALLDGVVTAQGRLWIAANPDDVLWLESAGGALGIRRVGRWLAASPEGTADPEHRAMAALHWDDVYGDRHSSVTVLCHRAAPDQIRAAFDDALVTDAELALGPDFLANLPSPFGTEHRDPCDDFESTDRSVQVDQTEGEDR
ncbi:ribosome hibernation factor-recruiting GTPase MRF [Gordonia neofelifaecis]|uniref:Cobalamin synthesis CobW domain-containing protein n=1 Tax=Gordonia neofelifaecis NRRL B-59395 TaxID=644548 RepID=F1YIY3_9ACTN|nr:GTP-binding protein [Gordonia neofelifaecis]EGD55430.1 cobalamin synthesis CobW domain-containing protein [Gordonia neofelifaecis NRRL B-59395]